jgi:hypothetical protein
MDIFILSYDQTDFGAQISFLGSECIYIRIYNLIGILFLQLYKISNQRIYHTTILILDPIFRFWALRAYFHFVDPQKYVIQDLIKLLKTNFYIGFSKFAKLKQIL